jgi:hypothetical protein
MAIQSNEYFNLTRKPITSVDPSSYNKNYIYSYIYIYIYIYIFFLKGGSVIIFYALKGSMVKKSLEIYVVDLRDECSVIIDRPDSD